MDVPPPLWGRPLKEYVTSYQFEEIRQRGIFNQDPPPSLTREVADALLSLARVGARSGPKGSGGLSFSVTMQNLRSILKLVQYPKAYYRLALPQAIGGCIKLMAGIKLNDKHLPFGYEYGYLCFRVLTIALGVCILQRSDRLDASIEVMEEDTPMNPQHDIMQHLGHHVSSGIFDELRDKHQGCIDSILGWARGQSPLVVTSDIELLFTMLWEDRKIFFKALRSTYYPGIASVVFVLWQTIRRDQNAATNKFRLTVLSEISLRYNLLATSDQQHAVSYMNIDLISRKYLSVWEANLKHVDLEDCREVISAYIDRFKPPHPILYDHMRVLNGPIILRSLAQYVIAGTEDLLPAVLAVTVKCIWEEMKEPSEEYKPDVFVDAIRDTFANYALILQNRVFRQMNHDSVREFVNVIIKYDLLDLAARAILMLELPSEPPVHALAGSVDYLPRLKLFYSQTCVSLPTEHMYTIWDNLFPEWFKFRSYLVWYPEIRHLGPKDREHIRSCLGVWNEIGLGLGYQVHEKSHFSCQYSRCHDPLGMGGIEFTCPACHDGAYCSARCQSLDWKVGGPRGPHAYVCSAKTLGKSQ